MGFPYRILIYIHVLSAICSIGPYFILLPMIKKLRTASGNVLDAYLQYFRTTVYFSKHAGHVLVLSGVLMVFMGPWTWKTDWILMTIAAMFLSLFFLASAFSPVLLKLKEENQDKEVLISKLKKSIWIYIFLLLLMLWFMVVKPSFW